MDTKEIPDVGGVKYQANSQAETTLFFGEANQPEFSLRRKFWDEKNGEPNAAQQLDNSFSSLRPLPVLSIPLPAQELATHQ
jgi:hypothetical protein